MHQTTQRHCCRLVFLAGCVLPTLTVVAWACSEKLPSTTARRLAAIEQMLGMRVTAASLGTPTPGVWRIAGFELADVETGELLLAADTVKCDPRGGTLRIELERTQIAPAAPAKLAECAGRAITVDWPRAVNLKAHDLCWTGDEEDAGAELLKHRTLTARLRTLDKHRSITGRQLIVSLGSEATDGDAACIEVHRNRQLSPPATRVMVDTAGKAVPTNWLAQLDALFPAGDPSSTFTGTVTLVSSPGSATGQLKGELNDVSLGALSRLAIDARATVTNFEMQWCDGQVTNARGVVVSGPGTMASGVAEVVQNSLYFEPQPGAAATQGESLEFGALGVEFDLSSEGLRLLGACPADDPARAPCVVNNEAKALFGRPSYYLPIAAIGNLLSVHGDEQAARSMARLPRATATR